MGILALSCGIYGLAYAKYQKDKINPKFGSRNFRAASLGLIFIGILLIGAQILSQNQ